TLSASAPAPLTATPPAMPNDAAREAAKDTASMVAISDAETVTPPEPVAVTPKSVVLLLKPSALRMYAATSEVMVLYASDTPIERAAPPSTPKPAARDTAPAMA